MKREVDKRRRKARLVPMRRPEATPPRPRGEPAVPVPATSGRPKLVAEVLQRGFTHKVFPGHLQLMPQMHELYEMELASAEAALMPDEDLVRNAGYFARVGTQWTRHFLICSGEPLRLPKHSSSQLRSFFQNNQFRTGYATHGLFPYRGKFHPQMIKGLLNAMGLRPGDTVVDPMMGSGTVLIEAKLMGIKSIGLDASPFCRFMAQVMAECSRVLRPGRLCTVVVGTNNNQLSKILGTSPEDVTGIDELIADWASGFGLHQVRKLSRQIRGMSNTMRTEYIVFFQRR